MTGVWWGKLRKQLIKVGDVKRKKWTKKVTKKTNFCFFPYKIQAQLVNLQTGFFFFFKKLEKGPPDGQMSLSHLVWPPVLISSCSVLAFGMGCHFLALIPPFTSVNPLVNRLLQSPSRTNNWEICTRIAGSTTTLRVIYRKCTSLKTGWAHRINIRLWISEENFHRELSRIIWYTLSFNYCYRYEINLAWIMYTANSSILHRKEKKLARYWAPDINTQWMSLAPVIPNKLNFKKN